MIIPTAVGKLDSAGLAMCVVFAPIFSFQRVDLWYVFYVLGFLDGIGDFYSDPFKASGVGYGWFAVVSFIVGFLLVAIIFLLAAGDNNGARSKGVTKIPLMLLALVSFSLAVTSYRALLVHGNPAAALNDRWDSQEQAAIQVNVNNLDAAVDPKTNLWGPEADVLAVLTEQNPCDWNTNQCHGYSFVATRSTGPYVVNVDRVNAETVIISARGGSGDVWCADVYTYAPATYGQANGVVRSGTGIPLADCTGLDSSWNWING